MSDHLHEGSDGGEVIPRKPPGPVAKPLEAGGMRASNSPVDPLATGYAQIVIRRKGFITIMAVAGGLLALLATLPQTKLYRARASLEIQGLNDNVLNKRELDPTSDSHTLTDSYLQTQTSILKSELLLDRVAGKLKIEPSADTVAEAGRVAVWKQALGRSGPVAPATRDQLAAMLAKNIRIRVADQTRIIEILADSASPAQAAEIANTLAQEYITQAMEGRWDAGQQTEQWLARQLDDLKIRLERSEDQLKAYAAATGLMYVDEKENVEDSKLRQLQQELSRVQADRIAKQSQFELATSSPPTSLPEVLDNGPLRDYQVKLTDLRRQYAELRSNFTAEFPRVQRLQAQIAEMEETMQKERANIVKRIGNEYQAALRRERLLAADYQTQSRVVTEQSQKAIHYSILKREVDTNRQLYDGMLQKVKEYRIASAMTASSARIIDRAKPPRIPVKPDIPFNVALGILFGSVFGVGFVIVSDRANRTLRAPGDAPYYLGVLEFGVIPASNAERQLKSYYYKKKKQDGADPRHSLTLRRRKNEIELVTFERSQSIIAETFRTTAASFLFSSQNGDRPRTIVITSPNPREGKTTVATNLAIALAEIRRRVLVIDADLHRPRLHEIFDLSNDRGLSDWLLGESKSDTPLIQETKVPGLLVLTAGKEQRNIPHLLHSDQLPQLLKTVRSEFDIVIIDTPPSLLLSDARVIGRLSDGVILVIRANATTRDHAIEVRDRLAQDNTRLLGTVLNLWDPHLGPSTYYGYYGGYRYQYYSTTGVDARP
jgi:capsular exopolysaccharide synthesis family protein